MDPATADRVERVRRSLEQGLDVNKVDPEGRTAMMMAAAEGHRPVVEVLLRHGANIALTDQDGDSAIDHARERGQSDIAALLETWPGKE